MEAIKIYKSNLKATDRSTGDIYTITGGNGSLYSTVRSDGENLSFTRQELKRMNCDINAIDDILDLIECMEAEKVYTNDGLNFITETEYNKLTYIKDDFYKISFEIVEA